MNVYDEANNLAKALKECTEVIELKKASEKVKENETNKKMLEDFRKIQVKAYTEQIQNGEVSQETKGKLQSSGVVVAGNPVVAEYLNAEQKFSVMWNDIMKILNDAIDIESTLQDNE